MDHLSDDQQAALMEEMQRGSLAYVRNLAAAEAAVQRGQFNLAKVLRAAAYTQRTLALNAARQLETTAILDPMELLTTILEEQQNGRSMSISASQVFLPHSTIVRERLTDLIRRSLASLAHHPDILEDDVALEINGCLTCGNLVEGSTPDVCDLCGAIMAEFEWFGPFYSGSHEHLGQLTPQSVVPILQQGPPRLAALILAEDDATLRRKPSPPEWSIKEIVGHLLEADKLCVGQVRSILEQTAFSHPVMPWQTHEGKGYQDLSAQDLAQRFTAERQKTLDLLHELTAHDWSKVGIIYGHARSILDVGTWHGNHDVGHLVQVERLLRQWDVQPRSPNS